MTSDASASKPETAGSVEAEADGPDPLTERPGRAEPATEHPGPAEPAAAGHPEPAGPVAAERPGDGPAGDAPAGDAPAGDAPDGAGPAAAVRLNRVAVGRPPEMMLGAIFLTFAALPLVLVGLAMTLQLGGVAPAMAQIPGIVVRFIGLTLLVIGVAFVALAWFSLTPRHWARSGATVFAGVEIVMLVIGMVTTAFDPVGVGLMLLAGAGAVLMYLPRSAEFMALAQRGEFRR